MASLLLGRVGGGLAIYHVSWIAPLDLTSCRRLAIALTKARWNDGEPSLYFSWALSFSLKANEWLSISTKLVHHGCYLSRNNSYICKEVNQSKQNQSEKETERKEQNTYYWHNKALAISKYPENLAIFEKVSDRFSSCSRLAWAELIIGYGFRQIPRVLDKESSRLSCASTRSTQSETRMILRFRLMRWKSFFNARYEQ